MLTLVYYRYGNCYLGSHHRNPMLNASAVSAHIAWDVETPVKKMKVERPVKGKVKGNR